MQEDEFWGRRNRREWGMDNGQPDETISTSVEDRQIVDGPCEALREQPSRLPEDYSSRYDNIAPQAGSLPDNNPKTQHGLKKVPTHSCVPWTAVILEGIVMALGRIKYGPFNWRKNQVAASVYVDAAERHLSLWNAGENDDDESKVSHLAHVRACCGILIDAIETGNLVDDRPKNQATIDLIKRNYDVTASIKPTA